VFSISLALYSVVLLLVLEHLQLCCPFDSCWLWNTFYSVVLLLALECLRLCCPLDRHWPWKAFRLCCLVHLVSLIVGGLTRIPTFFHLCCWVWNPFNSAVHLLDLVFPGFSCPAFSFGFFLGDRVSYTCGYLHLLVVPICTMSSHSQFLHVYHLRRSDVPMHSRPAFAQFRLLALPCQSRLCQSWLSVDSDVLMRDISYLTYHVIYVTEGKEHVMWDICYVSYVAEWFY